MSTRRHAGLYATLALSLVALPIVNGCTVEDPASEPEALASESIGEVGEACGCDSNPSVPPPYYPVPNPGPYYPPNGNPGPFPPPYPPAYTPGIYACSSSAGPSSLVVRNDGICFKVPQPVAAASETYCVAGACPPCWRLAREIIGCALQH